MIDNENIKDSIEVFCKYRIDPRNGRIIYPKKSKYFHFWVKVKK